MPKHVKVDTDNELCFMAKRFIAQLMQTNYKSP